MDKDWYVDEVAMDIKVEDEVMIVVGASKMLKYYYTGISFIDYCVYKETGITVLGPNFSASWKYKSPADLENVTLIYAIYVSNYPLKKRDK